MGNQAHNFKIKYCLSTILFMILLPFSPFAKNLERFNFKNHTTSAAAASKNNEIYIKDFGGIGDGITNNTLAFQKASTYLQLNGGTLIIDSGIYIVGMQSLSKSHSADGSFFDQPILYFKNAILPIAISGHNATLKAADGLKYGSFNPVTGEKDSIRKEGGRSSYYASAYTFINAVGCSSISVSGLTLDGNSDKLDIGPSFGTEGIQLSATGISLFNNKNVNIQDCYIHHCALDAIIIAWYGLKDSDPDYPHIIKNVKAEFNGRQGLSWVGGNDLRVTDCDFSSTGKVFNNGFRVVSKPSAGIDIETEGSIIKNGHFTKCRIYNNTGPGLLSIGEPTKNINFNNCTFIGTTNSAAYPKSEAFSFDKCIFVGKVERIYGSADKKKAASFKNCLFTLDSKMSPDGNVFGEYWEFYEAQNVVFENCTFDAANKRLPIVNTPEITFLNCTFSQNSNNDFNAAAIFKGTTKFVMKGKGKLEISQSRFFGNIIYNNQKANDIKNIKLY